MFFFLKNEFMDQITRLSCELSGQEYHDGDKRGKGYCEENLGLIKKGYSILLPVKYTLNKKINRAWALRRSSG